MSNLSPPPGWYPNPNDTAQQRWWDGAQWGEATRAIRGPLAGVPGVGAPPVAFGEAIRLGLTKWTLKGRASRSEYWYLVLATVILNVVVSIVTAAAAGGARQAVVYVIDFAVFCVVTKVLVRRYHDIGRSGWWLAVQVAAQVVAYGLLFKALATMLGISMSQLMSGKRYVVTTLHTSGSTSAMLAVGLVVGLAAGIWEIVWSAKAPVAGPNKWDEAEESVALSQ